MADLVCRWTGADPITPTLWTALTNWIDVATGIAPVHSPAAGADLDSVLFDTALASPTTMSPAGIDLEAGPGAALRLVRVGPNYNGTIGSLAVPLTVPTATVKAEIEGAAAGAMYITGGGAAGITLFDVTGARTSLTIGGVTQTLRLWKGIVDLRATATVVSTLYIGYVNSKTGDVQLTIPAGMTLTPASYIVDGGNVNCAVAITTLNLNGAIWRQAAALTTLNLNSGTFWWDLGTITLATVRGGTFDASSTQNAREVTAMVMYPGSIVNLNCNELGQITLGAGGITRHGGLLTLNFGMTIFD
jgi:hypothetical protein